MRDYNSNGKAAFRPRNDISSENLYYDETRNRSFSGSGSFTESALDATDGWLELFLTPSQKRTFSKWKENVKDKSITNRVTKNAFDKIVTIIPSNVAPNLITAFGFMCLGQAWYVTMHYGKEFPTACTWFAILNVLLIFVTSSLDQRHADRIRQRTPLGELFKYSCDCCSTVFLVILTIYLLGGTETSTQWYAVQASQLVLFTKHLSAFHRNDGLRYNVLTGPGEVIMAIVTLLAVRATFGLDWFIAIYEVSLHKIVTLFESKNINIKDETMEKISDPETLGAELITMIYYAMYVTAVIKSCMLRKPHGWSRFGLSASLLMRFLPAIFIHVGPASDITILDVMCDGFFMAVLTSDITLAKMAGREIHPWVVLMSMCAVLSHPVILTCVIVYYIAIFADLCHYLNMPLMTVCRNVYCDGVYDLCHVGHKTLFRNALRFGNRLLVGVVGDEDASKYKRPPIMTAAERCAEVEACKSVTAVIPNSPCFGLTPEFLDEHQIHVVAFGEEYLERYPNPDDDPYYSYPRKIGIARPLPRTEGLSTSDLIRRIQNAMPADEKKSPT